MNASPQVRPVADQTLARLVGDTAGLLAADAVQKAKSGHPGAPLGMRLLVAVLWLKYLRYLPGDPRWPARDRIIFSNGHAVALWYSFLYLAGFISLDDLKSFRQYNSLTPGHPEFPHTPGVEATTGPLGQGLGNAVGLAIAAMHLAEKAGSNVFPERVFCFAGDGCMQEGISHEACALAGRLKLRNLVVVYDANNVTIDGPATLSMDDDVGARFEAYGWLVIRIDGTSFDEIDEAYAHALGEQRPVLIIARTIIGQGSPKKAGTAAAHGEPLGVDELAAVKVAFNFPPADFHVPAEVTAHFGLLTSFLTGAAREWTGTVAAVAARDAGKDPARLFDLTVGDDILQLMLLSLPDATKPVSTRTVSAKLLDVLFARLPFLMGGSADLTPSNLTRPGALEDFGPVNPLGRYLRFGIREHGMGAVANGLALHGGVVPFTATFLAFYDYMRPPVRLAALSRLRVLFLFTHDSVFLGEDGPTHQPVEQAMGLRAVPGLLTFRPSNGIETAVAYHTALTANGPSAILLTRQNVEPWAMPEGVTIADVQKGAYRCYGESGPDVQLIFVATGSEVPVAIETAKRLERRTKVRVVSMPSAEVFRAQGASYRDTLIPASVPTVTVEAGSTLGWPQLLGPGSRNVLAIGIDQFGSSAPAASLREPYGLTADQIEARTRGTFVVA